MKTMSTEQNKSSHIPLSQIMYTTTGAVIIIAGIAAILKLSKTMMGDLKELGL